eukprot:1551199-Amphidinium_carterae.1
MARPYFDVLPFVCNLSNCGGFHVGRPVLHHDYIISRHTQRQTSPLMRSTYLRWSSLWFVCRRFVFVAPKE